MSWGVKVEVEVEVEEFTWGNGVQLFDVVEIEIQQRRQDGGVTAVVPAKGALVIMCVDGSAAAVCMGRISPSMCCSALLPPALSSLYLAGHRSGLGICSQADYKRIDFVSELLAAGASKCDPVHFSRRHDNYGGTTCTCTYLLLPGRLCIYFVYDRTTWPYAYDGQKQVYQEEKKSLTEPM